MAVPVIEIVPGDPAAEALWKTVMRISTTLGEERRWCLVGGLMVALFAIEADQVQRPTTDIDILADSRSRPSATEWATQKLFGIGARLHEVSGLDGERGFRLAIEDQVVDVLAPDGLGSAARTTENMQTIQIPGGSQALNRLELVEIVVGGERGRIRRPTLIGAILLKARAIRVHSEPEDQRQDVVTLLSLLEDPRSARADLSGSEVKWLRSIERDLGLDDPSLGLIFDPPRLRVASAAYAILTA